MGDTFDADAFNESIDGLDCIGTTMAALKALSASLTDDKAEVLATAMCGPATDAGGSLDTAYLLFSGYLVFVMQAGFAMLCAGSVRTKNTMNILLKNVLDACVGAIFFYLFGYGFAYGGSNPTEFIGDADFALETTRTTNDGTAWSSFFFQWAFSAAAATIVSGSVAERTTFGAYLGYSAFLTGFVYPVVVHWVWSSYGWLNAFRDPEDLFLDMGMVDFAGSGVVHMVGGTAGLMGAMIVGPRMGRFDADGKPISIRGHSATMVVIGTFLLWFGWYGFNPGSQLIITGGANATIVARVAVTTTLAPAIAGCTNLFLTKVQEGTWDLLAVCNGLLAGLVGVTAGCSVLEPWAALIVGFLAAFVFNYGERLLLMLKIDDPLSAAPMHMMCGALGVFFVGFMAYEPYVLEVYGDRDNGVGQGVFYGGNGKLLACQVVGILVIMAWVGTLLGGFFFILNMLGLLRVAQEEELAGLDVSKHGGSAYEAPIEILKADKPAGF